jgi:hypothetical protein
LQSAVVLVCIDFIPFDWKLGVLRLTYH